VPATALVRKCAACGQKGRNMRRQDYAYPFRIDAVSHQAAQTSYPYHVAQMIRQILLTDPGERVCLPEFGCGLRRLVFAPHSDALQATAKLQIMQSLSRWLAGEIVVKTVNVSHPGDLPDGVLQIDIEYVLVETQELQRAMIEVR
jgi:phage baseplate assembly protein W